MTTFEWSALALITFGMVVPFWILAVLTIFIAEDGRRKRRAQKVTYVHDYVELMQGIAKILKSDDGRFNGPSLVAYLRDFKEYPQYRDATLLFLEEINVTGSSKFDDMVRNELKLIEADLLGLKDE